MKDELTVADDLLFGAYRKFKALDGEGVTDERERARRELKIYAEYFTPLAGIAANPHSDGKTTTARAFIAEHIHPGYMLIPGAIDLYAKWAPTIPAQERAELLEPFRALLIVTAVRWPDAKPQALNVLAVVDEISGVSINADAGISQAAADQLLAMFGRFDQALRDGLKTLSEALFKTAADNGAANADRADKTLAAINAARDEIAAVGADSRAAREAAEIAADNSGELLANQNKATEERRKRGKAARQRQMTDGENADAMQRAAADMDTALQRVNDTPDVRAGKHGALIEACRRVCKKFRPLTTKKNAMGEYTECAPLTGAGGKTIKPETLAKNWRTRFGNVKAHKRRASE